MNIRFRHAILPTYALLLALHWIAEPVGATPLHDAVRSGDASEVSEILEVAEDIDETDYVLGSALHLAVVEQQPEMAGILIDGGADIDLVSEINGKTALLLASELGDLEMVQVLVGNGADIQMRDNLGQTALHLATRFGQESVVKALLDAGASIDIRDAGEGMTPLSISSLQGDVAITKLLVSNGADIEARSASGHTPFSFATSMESYVNVGGDELIRYLAELGVDTSPEDNAGFTPLKWASSRNVQAYKEITNILKEMGVER